MSVNWDDIKKEYIDSKGKAVLKELAEKYKVKIGTLRSRKSREEWDKEIDNSVATCNATQEKKIKNVATQNKATKVKQEVVKDIDKEIVEEETEESNTTLTKYDTNVKERLLEVEAWARDGLIDEQIAHNLGIALSTFYEYKKKHPEFSESLKKGKEVVDIEVENALLKRALGYKYTEVTREPVKDPMTGEIKLEVTKKVVKEVTPDTTAQIYWLKNRKPTTWRDKQEISHGGNININDPFKGLTTEELKKLAKMSDE